MAGVIASLLEARRVHGRAAIRNFWKAVLIKGYVLEAEVPKRFQREVIMPYGKELPRTLHSE